MAAAAQLLAWVHRDEKCIVALETDTAKTGATPGQGPGGFKLQLVSAQSLDTTAWEEEKRAQLGPPIPSGPVAAVEVKPHPCRVPGYEKEVLCATYPVWENRETRQGRKIGLNIVILPALGPDKQPDPIFATALARWWSVPFTGGYDGIAGFDRMARERTRGQ